MALYRIGELSMVVRQYYDSARKGLVSAEVQEGMSSMDAFTAKITVGDQSTEVNVFGGKGYKSKPAEITVDGIDFSIRYGAKVIELPFSLKLDDFQLERYPGSNSPSSYASEVTVIDESKDLVKPYRIYMNNVLNYGGYRFFQSSYDRDEQGTILSVNHDTAGTIITYIGYLLMSLGMFLTIFNKNSRFRLLARFSAKLRESRKTAIWVIVIASGFLLSATQQQVRASDQTMKDLPVVSKEHAAKFGKLLVQDKDGRIRPVNTLSSEVLRKIARKNSLEGLNPDQVFLGILTFPEIWQTKALIKVANPELKDYLKIDGKYAAFTDIVDVHTSSGYQIGEFVERAYAKKPSKQNKFDKEVMKVDERINIFYMVYSGMFLTVFPIPDHPNSKWVTSKEADKHFEGEEALFVKGILSMYFDVVKNAVESGDWSSADEHLGYILQYQEDYGNEVIPDESRIDLEIFYNNFNIFKRLASYYGLIGFILLVLHFINILKPKINLKLVIRISSILVILLFLVHTAGLIIRWNISGHAPWSNGYESMIYIGWATILSGLIFLKRSEVTLAVTAVLTSLILAVAGMSWMDPEITNLVPVLKSYWLIIHVAIITASYGFLALGALLGFFNLILMNLKTKNNFERLNLTITELTYIIEMTLIIGLFMLTIGTFLGGVWANESWGRYWGWDPKETWALVTVLVYSFVAHMRFIPGFRGNFAYSFASLISYGSVLMTYFGVNYYLSGLHSYAKGDPVPVPNFVYYTLVVIAVVGIMAFISERKYSNKPVKVE
jgi:cytochrome c-type biogenesis protein CcsB